MDKLNVMLDEGAVAPTRAHPDDAGLDIYLPTTYKTMYVEPRTGVDIDTGVHVEIPRGHVGLLKSKSGLNVRHGITSEGVIDAGYTGSIHVKLYNNGYEWYKFLGGDKISQLVIVPCFTPEVEVVEALAETERGEDGFGSSGR